MITTTIFIMPWYVEILILSLSALFLANAYRVFKLGRNIYIYNPRKVLASLQTGGNTTACPLPDVDTAAKKPTKKNGK